MGTSFLKFILIVFPTVLFSQTEVYLFSYFTDNGQDGLHFASSNDGLTWETVDNGKSFLMPMVGDDRLMRDPCIIKGPDGSFQMVWTSGWNDQIIGHASSKDLIHWSEQRAIPVMAHEPTAKNAWAPEVFYDDKEKHYLIFWATTIPGRHGDVAESEREKGLNHRMYYTKTEDFKTFAETNMFFDPNFSVIDATILKDNSSYFMFVKNENPNPPEKNIRVVRSKNPEKFPREVSPPITGNYWAEGPTSIRIGEFVYVYFDKYTEHQYGAVRSKDMEHWEDVSDSVKFPEGMRHGSVFKVSEEVLARMKTE
tara:strand:+ start:376 stop:1305 length:930 start_codon:yes stop_codon:yes gene_type:complete